MWPRIGTVPTYGVLYFLGIVAHFLIGRRVARRLGLRRRVWIAAGVCYIVGMTAGAKFLYHARRLEFDPMVVFSARHYVQGGLWGGLLAYMLLAVPLALLLARNKRAGLDLVALCVPVPWAMAKLGCLLNGCCYGKPCSLPWGVVFPAGAGDTPAGIPLHPTQIYEIIIMALLVVAFRLLRDQRWRGTMLLWFVAIYGLGRAATDMFRGDADRYVYIGPITLTQLVCVTATFIAIGTLALCRRSPAKEGSQEALSD